MMGIICQVYLRYDTSVRELSFCFSYIQITCTWTKVLIMEREFVEIVAQKLLWCEEKDEHSNCFT